MFTSTFMSTRAFSLAKIAVAILAMCYHYYYFAGKRTAAECPEGFVFTPQMLSRDAFLGELEVPMGECFFPADYDEGEASGQSRAGRSPAVMLPSLL
jgi:hypothetical protein